VRVLADAALRFCRRKSTMEMLIAIELIAGAIFVLIFIRNLERELSLRSYQRLLDSYDDDGNDAARADPSFSARRQIE
jgi:hypothetical protein